MLRAHRIELNPNNKQATYFAKASGVARFAYNWALAEWKKRYEAGEKPNQIMLRRELNAIKREQFPWMLEVTKNAPQMAIIQLGDAFQNFFKKRAAYPTFRKKGINDRFTLTNDQFALNGSRIRIPNLGWVRMRESLRFAGKIISATISRKADRWFVSVTVETPKTTLLTRENQVEVGVDLGVSDFATLSTGETIKGPKPHKALLVRLKRLSKSLSRKQKGSNNRKKAKLKLAKLHYRIANVRNDSLHQLTTRLTRDYPLICIEDLNVKGMMKNRRLSRSIADMGFYEFRRQLEYKAVANDSKLVVADRWFASSKRCSACNYQLDVLPLSVREWQCPLCNATHQRDVNAAINLKNWAVSSTVTACGATTDGAVALAAASHVAMKQEANVIAMMSRNE
jgi:putative transposase